MINEGGADITVTLPEGNYDITSFPVAMKTALDAASVAPLTYTVTISATSNKITIAATGAFSIKFASNSTSPDMWKILGFPYQTNTSSAASLTGTMPIRLDGDEYYVLSIDNIGNENMSSSFTMRGLMDIIPMHGNFGDIIYYKPNEHNNLVLGQMTQLKLINIRITDQDGFDLPIADNCEVFLKFRVISTQITYDGKT